jgi:hypothetical protein
MAKTKKKISLHAQHKVQEAQHKKVYMERLRFFCTIIKPDDNLFELIPLYLRDAIYRSRGTVKIKVDKDVKITKRFVKIMYGHLDKEMRKKFLDLKIPDVPVNVNLVDYYQIISPLEIMLMSAPTFAGREKFDAFYSAMEERYTEYQKALGYIIHCACHAYCDMSKRALYTFSFTMRRSSDVISSYSTGNVLHQIITLGLYPLDVRYVSIHGDRRPVVQVGEVLHHHNKSGLVPTTVQLKRLRPKDPKGHTEIPVYIQQHAVDRIMQRACGVTPGIVASLIHTAFTQKRRIIREGSRYLVECYYYDIKIGYFVGMFLDGIFVILTFLLITHSGTPEGRKLEKLTGLQRSDISFLAIDDLKTLINSDIRSDERISKIFIEAGCESILDMNFYVSIGDFEWLWDPDKQNSELSKMIAEYIQLGNTDEEYFENE